MLKLIRISLPCVRHHIFGRKQIQVLQVTVRFLSLLIVLDAMDLSLVLRARWIRVQVNLLRERGLIFVL